MVVAAQADIDAEKQRRGIGTLLEAEKAPEWFHQGQWRAWLSRALELVITAGNQGGKTAVLAPLMLREIQRCAPLIRKMKRGNFLYVGPTLQLLEAQAIPHFTELFEETHQLGKMISGGRPKFRFSPEGSKKLLGFVAPIKVQFAYANDSSNLESVTALAGCWDEAGQKENKQESYEAYNRRLGIARATTFEQMHEWLTEQKLLGEFDWWIKAFYDIEGPKATFGRRFWATTPYEWNWFKTLVYDAAEKAKAKGDPKWELLNFETWMNPMHSEAECRSHLDGMPEWRWKMMYEGLYTKPAGLVFDCFDDRNILEDGWAVPDGWKRWIGLDFGDINTAAVVLVEDPESGDLALIAEYHPGYALTYAEHVAKIKGLAKCTPDGAGGSHQEDGWREAFRKNGLPIGEPPNVGVPVQFGCVYEQLKTKKLRVMRSCTKTIGQFNSFSHPLDDNQEPMDGYVDEKLMHMMAAVRYIVTKLRPPKAHTPAVSAAPNIQTSPITAPEPEKKPTQTSDGLLIPTFAPTVTKRPW